MKASLVRRFVAIAVVALSMLTTQARGATLAFEAFYDPDNGNITIAPYDSDTNTPWVGTADLALVDFNSTAGVFTGSAANIPAGASFSTDIDNRVNWALLGSSVPVSVASPYDLGDVAQTSLTQAFIDTDFESASAQGSVLGTFSWGALGGATGAGPVTALAPVPEPTTLVSLAGGGLAALTYAGRRTLRRRRRTKAC